MILFSRLILIIFLIYSSISYTQAGILTPPKLTDVIKTNEKLQKTQVRKIRNIKIQPITLSEEKLSYRIISSHKSINLYRYDTVDMIVQELNLAKGAYVDSVLNGVGFDENSGEPLFQKNKLSDIVQKLKNKPFSLINGQFFDPSKKYTTLSFGIKMNDIVRTAGADNRNESKNILIFSKTGAQIIPYSWENLSNANGYFAMVNLTLSNLSNANEYLGRTYICLKNPNALNASSEVLIFTAKSATEYLVEQELLRWGCTKDSTSKLDSSGSSQLWLNNNEFVYGNSRKGSPDHRGIPHIIAIYE